MGKSLNELNLTDELLPTADQLLDEIPEFGTFRLPPQPGPFRFRLPQDLTRSWDVFSAGEKGDRVALVFDKDRPLVITASLGNRYNGDPYETRLTNNERPRGKSGVVASDLHYLLKAFGVTKAPKTNREWVNMVTTFGGREFGADLVYSWRCSTERDIYAADGQGGQVKVEGTKGCGRGYYERDVQKVNGETPYQIQCACGALVRAFANLDNLRA
jgi:hypothetical protein